MYTSDSHDPQAAVPDGARNSFSHRELNILGDIFRLLPTGITVQDEQGRFVLMNDAAAAQLGAAASSPTPSQSAEFNRRCTSAIELLRSGQSVTEETITDGPSRQVFLTTHQPVRIAGCDLLLSSTADITEQKNFEDQLFRSAYYDELTDLPARRVIEYRVNSLLEQGEDQGQFALAFLDIDNFKHINDYYGHSTGDALLVQLTKRLGLDLRQSDMLSRISGDEFLLLLHPIHSQQEVADYLALLLQRMRAPFFIGQAEIFASTSVGVSLYPDHGQNYEILRQNADIAMYRVKNAGKGAAMFFDDSMEREAAERTKIEQSLRLAILDKRFCCAFQTKVDIRTREVTGVEALVRLRDDEGVIQRLALSSISPLNSA